MQAVMRWLWLVILVLGLISLVAGIMFVAAVPGATSQLEKELARSAGTKVEDVDKIYDDSMAALELLFAADPNSAFPGNPNYEAFWMAANTADAMGLAKTNLGGLQQMSMLGILNIIVGIALMLLGFVVYGMGRGMALIGAALVDLTPKATP